MSTSLLRTIRNTTATVMFALLLFVVPVAAQDPLCNDPAFSSANTEYCADQGGGNPIVGPDGILTGATELLATIAGVAAVIVVVVAGLLFAISAGDPGKANKARNAIIYALVGLVIAIMARTIVVWVLTQL